MSWSSWPWSRRLAALLAHPQLPGLAALLGMLLLLPALGQGLQLDDHLHRAWIQLSLGGEAPGPWWDLYAIARDPEDNRAAMELGASPWWMLPHLRLRFLRPLAAATHWLDYGLWPQAAWLMHAQSLAWYGAMVVITGALLRRWLGPTWVAGLATLIFAVDDAHAMPASWIAQRNALLAGVLTVGMLWAHDRARRDGWRTGRWLAPLLLALALLSGESAVGGLGYVVAHAALFDARDERGRRSGLERLRIAVVALWPYLVVVIAWRALYAWLGCGAYGSGVYLDPGLEPGAFAAVLPDRAAALTLAQLAGISAERWAVDPLPWTVARRGAVLVAGLLLVALAPRLRRDRGLAVCVVGAGLALVPAATAVPHDRLLLLVGLGSSAALASIVATAVGQGRSGTGPWWSRAPAGLLAGPVVFVHLVLAPYRLPQAVLERGAMLAAVPRGSVAGLPADPRLAEQVLVIVNAPPTFVPASLWLMPSERAVVLPRRLRVLGSTIAPVIVQRPAADSLVLQPVGGYLGDPFTALLRGPAHPFEVGDRVTVPGFGVEILAVTEGRPTAVETGFDVPLEDPSLRFIVWRGDRFVPFTLPAVGAAVAVPGRAPAP